MAPFFMPMMYGYLRVALLAQSCYTRALTHGSLCPFHT